MKLLPGESDLVGDWIDVDGDVIGDDVSQRISDLVKNHLQRITADESGWEVLFRDPQDGRY